MTLSELFADFITKDVSVSKEAAELAKRSIADSVGAMIAGSKTQAAQQAMELSARTTARSEAAMAQPNAKESGATIAGLGKGYLPRDAAFVNGISGHELELDDTSSSNLGHPTIAVLPALLAIGEEQHCSGEALLEAFLLATEVECKIGRICAGTLHERGWHASSITGVLGAAAGCSRLLRLDGEKTRHALGIAASMASGLRENFGTTTKSIHIGKTNEDGLRAALLSQAGFTASRKALDGREGYVYEYTTKPLKELLSKVAGGTVEEFAQTLGNDWDICSPGFAIKRYPSCSSTHRAVDGLALLIDREAIRADDIEAIAVGLSKPALRELVSPDPKDGEEAKFSIGFQIALHLAGITNMPENYTKEVIMRPHIQNIIRRTSMYNAECCDGLPVDMGVGPALVSIRLKDGSCFEHQQVYPVGHLTNPIPDDELQAKFTRCTEGNMPKEASDALYERLMRLETVRDIAEIMEYMAR